MKKLFTSFAKRISTGLCVIITVVGLFTPTTAYAAPKYSTHSPLLSGDTMAIDEIDPYELICYGVFLSNFCVPFVDTYATAFSQTASTGSKGAGIHALKFATGGDISANSIVNRMTNYVMGTLANQYQELMVIDKGFQNGTWQAKTALIDNSGTGSAESAEARPAKLADLLPLISGIVKVDNVDAAPEFDYNIKASYVWDHAWLSGVTADSDYDVKNKDAKDGSYNYSAGIRDFKITAGVLGEFYISEGSTSSPTTYKVFDMTNGWDIQIPSQCLLYAAYKDEGKYLGEIMFLVENAHNIPLVMDSVGNICALKSPTELIIIIPAYLNQHLTSPNFINLTGSAVLNTIACTTDKLNIASSASGIRAVNNSAAVNYDGSDILGVVNSAGLGSVIHKGSDLEAGTSLLYNMLSDYDIPVYSPLKSFADFGLDTKNKLRWSTLVYHNADTSAGLDLQNVIDVGTTDSGTGSNQHDATFIVKTGERIALNTNNKYVFSYDTQLQVIKANFSFNTPEIPEAGKEGKSIDKKDAIYEFLSLFQTAAQCYIPESTSENPSIKSYYCELQVGNKASDRRQLINGIDTINSSQSDKSELLYVPVGVDYSHLTNSKGFWDYVGSATDEIFTTGGNSFADLLQINKGVCAIAVDLYHNNLYGLPTNESRLFANFFVDTFNISEPRTVTVTYANPFSLLKLSGQSDVQVTRNGIIKMFKTVLTSDIIGIPIKDAKAEEDLLEAYDGSSAVSTDLKPASLNPILTSNWSKIAVSTPTLTTAASYLGLRDDYMFSTFASSMYYTYLDMYGFINGQHLFDTSIYTALQSEVCSLSPAEMGEKIMTQGLTAEQKEQVLKDNAYLMLSTNNDGREYRSRMVSGMIEEWLIDSYDKTCYGDTESEYFQTLTSTSKSFVNLPTYAENWLTEWVVEHWNTVLPILLIFLFVLVAAFGTLNGKKISWILANMLLTTCMLILLPGAAEIAPYLVEKVSDTAFKDVIGTMAISEAVEDDTIMADIEKQYAGYSDEIQAAVKSISGLGTSGSLLLKQDMTRKVVPAQVSTSYDQLKGLATAQWLIPSLLSMTGADDEAALNDYVYRSVGEKRLELRGLKVNTDKSDLERIRTLIMSVSQSVIHSSDFDTNLNTSSAHQTDLILHTLNGIGLNMSYDYETLALNITNELNTYETGEKLNSVNYLQGTETLLPYFYLVAYDSLINTTGKSEFSAITPADYFNAMQHADPSGLGVFSNKITLKDNNVQDFLDLDYLFTVYVPYLNGLQEATKEARKGHTLGPAYNLYFDEEEAFLFECNWADKILNAYDFGDDAKPDTYISRYGREMIFSRAQLSDLQAYQEANGLPITTVKDLTEVELRCIEINEEVDKQWTLLLNYVGTDGVTTQILAEQMAITATTAFNTIMSKDRVVNSNYALYPNAVSIRTINFDTMLKLVLMSNFGLADTNQNSMRIVLAESGLLMGFVLWILALLVTHVVPFVTGLSMAVVFYASIFSCVYNAAVDGKDKLKTCGGAAVTCLAIAVETCAYVYSYALIIGNTNKMLSVDKIAAGTTVATGKVLAILLITIAYLILLIFQAWKNAVNFRDMGAQMWMSYSKKSYEAVTTFFKNFASKVKGAIKHTDPTAAAMKDAMDGVEVQAKLDDEVKVKNTAADPLFTKDANSSSEATYIWGSEDESDNSGYILNPHHRDPAVQTGDKSSDTTTKTESSDESKDA